MRNKSRTFKHMMVIFRFPALLELVFHVLLCSKHTLCFSIPSIIKHTVCYYCSEGSQSKWRKHKTTRDGRHSGAGSRELFSSLVKTPRSPIKFHLKWLRQQCSPDFHVMFCHACIVTSSISVCAVSQEVTVTGNQIKRTVTLNRAHLIKIRKKGLIVFGHFNFLNSEFSCIMGRTTGKIG